MRLWFVPVMFFAACKGADPYIAAGQSLNGIGLQFVLVAHQMDIALDAHTVSAEEYQRWVTFGEHFQLVYPLAIGALEAAKAAGDAVAAQRAQDTVVQLGQQLSQFIPTVVGVAVLQAGAKP